MLTEFDGDYLVSFTHLQAATGLLIRLVNSPSLMSCGEKLTGSVSEGGHSKRIGIWEFLKRSPSLALQ